jgi:hypothetical protein
MVVVLVLELVLEENNIVRKKCLNFFDSLFVITIYWYWNWYWLWAWNMYWYLYYYISNNVKFIFMILKEFIFYKPGTGHGCGTD